MLAIGVWIGLLAGRIIAALQQERPAQMPLRVCILESGEPARRLAKALLASERPPLDAETVFLCGSDWARFDPVADLSGGRLCAVVARSSTARMVRAHTRVASVALRRWRRPRPIAPRVGSRPRVACVACVACGRARRPSVFRRCERTTRGRRCQR